VTSSERQLGATLPGASYCNPAVQERVWERVFHRFLLCAGREEQLKELSDFFTLTVGRKSVLPPRDRDGRLRGFYNLCRHRGSRLCTEEGGPQGGPVQPDGYTFVIAAPPLT